MGAGILPTTIHNNKLDFLFGKENKYADTPGWSDIGGGTDNDETFMQTAMREGAEELTGFLGMENDIKKLLTRYGTYNIDWGSPSGKTYRMHIFPMAFDPMLPVYYNNNHKFIERKLSATMVKNSKIFEKDEIRWVSIDDIPKMRKKFRSYFQKTADMILDQRTKIDEFIRDALRVKKSTKNKTRKNKRKGG
jgi:ADP-ribose pyrophosphatase YjhB (NUDIX family)